MWCLMVSQRVCAFLPMPQCTAVFLGKSCHLSRHRFPDVPTNMSLRQYLFCPYFLCRCTRVCRPEGELDPVELELQGEPQYVGTGN